jgi:hypothetical protein
MNNSCEKCVLAMSSSHDFFLAVPPFCGIAVRVNKNGRPSCLRRVNNQKRKTKINNREKVAGRWTRGAKGGPRFLLAEIRTAEMGDEGARRRILLASFGGLEGGEIGSRVLTACQGQQLARVASSCPFTVCLHNLAADKLHSV